MNKVMDNAILLLFSAVMIFQTSLQTEPVIALLLGIIAAAFGIVYAHKLPARICLVLLFCLAGLFIPQLLLFLPVPAYHGSQGDRKEQAAYGTLLMLMLLYTYKTAAVSPSQITLLILLCVLGICMSLRTRKLEATEQSLIQIRDSSIELSLALQEKNKHLMEKQDYEIYLATLKERNRIAREIHDNVGHMLSRSILQIGALSTIHKEEPLHTQLSEVNETLNHAMNSIRESVHDLHDDSIDLKQAITEAAAPLQNACQVHMDYDMSSDIPRNVKYCLIATVKEAVSNILRHSNADSVSILLREHPGFYQLCVEDNGSVAAKSLDGGIGLENMRERVEALGGTLRIRTEQGFQIFITIKKEM